MKITVTFLLTTSFLNDLMALFLATHIQVKAMEDKRGAINTIS